MTEREELHYYTRGGILHVVYIGMHRCVKGVWQVYSGIVRVI